MKYPYLLFDADDTLFDFPRASARAFSIMCRMNDIPDTPDTLLADIDGFVDTFHKNFA